MYHRQEQKNSEFACIMTGEKFVSFKHCGEGGRCGLWIKLRCCISPRTHSKSLEHTGKPEAKRLSSQDSQKTPRNLGAS